MFNFSKYNTWKIRQPWRPAGQGWLRSLVREREQKLESFCQLFLTSTDKLGRQKGFKNLLFNTEILYFYLYSFVSALSVLCHGSPAPQNVVFLYKDGVPVEAKVGSNSNSFNIFGLNTSFLIFIIDADFQFKFSAGDPQGR